MGYILRICNLNIAELRPKPVSTVAFFFAPSWFAHSPCPSPPPSYVVNFTTVHLWLRGFHIWRPNRRWSGGKKMPKNVRIHSKWIWRTEGRRGQRIQDLVDFIYGNPLWKWHGITIFPFSPSSNPILRGSSFSSFLFWWIHDKAHDGHKRMWGQKGNFKYLTSVKKDEFGEIFFRLPD